MFLLLSILLGLVFALVLGGRPSRLLSVKLRCQWTVPLALVVQAVLFSRVGESISGPLRGALHLVTYALLMAFALANVRIRALVPIFLGMVLNATAILANGGRMPLSATAAKAAGLPVSVNVNSNVSESADRLRFLGDVFALPRQLPLANVFSLGDVLLGCGMMLFIVIVTTDDARDRAFSPSRMLEPLRSRNYRLLAAGRFVSHVGDWLTLAALIGWIYAATNSTGQAAALLLSRLAPPILGGGVAALIVDRLPKQRLLVSIELGRGLAVAGALAGVLSGAHEIVFAALACSGALAAVSNASVPSLLPSLLPAEQLPSANAGLGIAKDGAMALGAVGAGLALSWLGVSAALVADLGTFAFAMVLFSLLPALPALRPREALARGRPRSLGYVVGRRWLVLLILSFAAATLATGLTNATLPRFFDVELGFGAGGYGFGIAALAGGLALGQVLIGFARVGPTAGRWIGAGLIVMAGLFVLLALDEHPATALLIVAAIGFVDGTTDVLFETVVQRHADPRYYGAVFGFASAFITTTMMGAIAVAPLANQLLAPRGVILGASVFLVGAGAIAVAGMGRPRSAPVLRSAVEPL